MTDRLMVERPDYKVYFRPVGSSNSYETKMYLEYGILYNTNGGECYAVLVDGHIVLETNDSHLTVVKYQDLWEQ